jgi:L-lactate utilization protein LutC
MEYSKVKNKETLLKVVEALKANGINAHIAESREDAKKLVLEMLPKGSPVMTYTSITLDELGLTQEINESGEYKSEKTRLYSLNKETDAVEMNRIGSAPEYGVGSVHAVTEDGKLVIASNTGSQLPAHAYGAKKMILVVGAQKIVKDLDDAMKRIYEYTLPLESERAKKAYGVAGSNVSKLLIINKEVNPDRVHLIFVPENIGF